MEGREREGEGGREREREERERKKREGERERGRERHIKKDRDWKQFDSPDLTRPKSRMTRRARRMRTMPVGWLVTMIDIIDMATMKVSSRLQGFSKKARNQWEKALIASSTVKSSVKKRFSLSSISCSWVAEPSGLVRLSINSASMIVVPKFCAPNIHCG